MHPDADPTTSVLVVQDYKFGMYLGRLDVMFDDDGKVTGWGGNPLLMDKDVAEGKHVLEVTARITSTILCGVAHTMTSHTLAAVHATFIALVVRGVLPTG